MTCLEDVLKNGYVQGVEMDVFRCLTHHADRSSVEIFCGLMMGQKVAFKRARQTRAHLHQYLLTKRSELLKIVSTVLVLAPLARCVISLANDPDGWDLLWLSHCPPNQWKRWGVVSWLPDRIGQCLRLWTRSGADVMLQTDNIGIGPWTRKSFGLMCRNENHLLHEDRWIKDRWLQLCRLLKVSRFIRRFEHPELSARQLTFLLWRITKIGIAQLANNKPLERNAFI